MATALSSRSKLLATSNQKDIIKMSKDRGREVRKPRNMRIWQDKISRPCTAAILFFFDIRRLFVPIP